MGQGFREEFLNRQVARGLWHFGGRGGGRSLQPNRGGMAPAVFRTVPRNSDPVPGEVMTTAATAPPPTRPAAPKKEWAPRIWEGCNFSAWVRLLLRNRCAVGLPYLYIAVIVTFVSFMHSVLRVVQEAIYGRRARRVTIDRPPLFILGHWRTGTTLLHEYLILDERHAFPNTYQCLDPNHFLLTERAFTRWLPFLMPSRRPMDNMAAGWDRPQEEEFALCMLGERSPYLTIAFPNNGFKDTEYFDLETVPPAARQAWKRNFLWFLKRLTFKDPRRLVLKSPTHSCRIPTLLEMFPDAQFVHIVRDPYVVFPSTVNLWKSLYRAHGFQTPNFNGLEEHVFETFNHLYDRLEEGKKRVEPRRYYELKYEDLVRDPVGQMRALYEHLGLGGFEEVLPRLQQYLAATADYQTNRYEQSPELRARIKQRWGGVIERYGYDAPAVP